MKKIEEARKEQIVVKKRLNETYEESEWSKFSTVENELENIEKSLNERFSKDDSDCSDSDEEKPVKTLYCVACGKYFQSPKAFQNHEGSKKHKQNAARLQTAADDEESESE